MNPLIKNVNRDMNRMPGEENEPDSAQRLREGRTLRKGLEYGQMKGREKWFSREKSLCKALKWEGAWSALEEG